MAGRKHSSFVGCLVLISVLAGCSTTSHMSAAPRKSPLSDQERFVGTHETDSMPYHAVVHYPREHALRYPGMIVGVEKSKAEALNDGRSPSALKVIAAPSKADRWLSSKLREDSDVMFISHVVAAHTKAASGPSSSPCFLYSVYGHDEQASNADRSEIDDISSCHSGPPRKGNPFLDSWTAVSRISTTLSSELARTDRKYSHVIVVVMGWNTEQIESIQNFNSITERLAATAPDRNFSPFVIGVTWPSKWRSGFFDTIVKALSLGNKANDADELGVGWLGAILEHGVLPAVHSQGEGRAKLLVIGHSFGARATSQAVCRGTMLMKRDGVVRERVASEIDWLIALQGAYSLNRFSENGAGIYDVKYPNLCPSANKLIFTASRHDTAASLADTLLPEGNFAGTHATFTKLTASGLGGGMNAGVVRFATYTADSKGALKAHCGPRNDPDSRLRYIDASEAIYYNAFDTGAGSHSDIYRKNTARMIWEAMSDVPACGGPANGGIYSTPGASGV